ncbi:MAG: DUF1007 family protein [Alphaproteobacteria bacterium]|nr:DUF1007 family protein [Alphaproteobacteria bacterium]
MLRKPAWKTAAITGGLLALSTGLANAHPHVFAQARLEVVIGKDGDVEALRHIWRFDELFSSTVLLEFDANANLKLEADELEAVGNVVKDSLADFNYYTSVMADGKDVQVNPPDRINVDFQDQQLLMFFSVSPAKAMPLTGTLSFGAYDPTMYAALDFMSDDDLVIDGSAQACSSAVVRPDPDEVLAQNQQSLTEAFFNDPGGNDISKFFATRLELTC